jgi:hypothetical protein
MVKAILLPQEWCKGACRQRGKKTTSNSWVGDAPWPSAENLRDEGSPAVPVFAGLALLCHAAASQGGI